MKLSSLIALGVSALAAAGSSLPVSSQEDSTSSRQRLIAANTQAYTEKQGFKRKPTDIINTLKDNNVTQFSIFLDGLSQTYDLDKTVKGNGPFTVFAPSDKAFKKLPETDRQTLWANRKKLSQVMKYHVVYGQIPASALRTKKSLKTLEGHSITLQNKGGDIYADKALVLTTDIPCSNGVIHIVDDVIMPTLAR